VDAVRILLAEDDRILRKAGEVSLRKKGYEVIPAVDGADALAKALEQTPDLVLLDVMMPKMNGFDVLFALKADPRVRDIPVIMLTNLAQPQDITRAAAAGAHSYLVKSNMNLDQLSARISEALSQRVRL
jgi:two-component system alkaline phosphatase synthesis response regulator PhoP